ncbi:hypothetical protein [Mucilaginibacter lappiensis]|uniref:Uncharacterized protein n=1 Tax=Mucilaginibacter lappiensis TaxID=354630 RepID=A0A841JG84_9SPHI|nr:hypothetical protein [Mucilaginibacter lappiensis]MBB6111491.1 hypothetical protein [Mucilaginibacter lappiensis]MBB6130173.1 hypothetical protein [Mucilaginibacter lappiensis]
MAIDSQVLPRIVIRSIGGGLLLMALFTMMWTGVAQGGLQQHDHHAVLILFSIFSVIFVVYGITVLIAAQRFPKFTGDSDVAEGKMMATRFGIIFGIEGTAIPVVSVILLVLGYQQFTLPAIALIVGLHFYPMAKIFNRKIDYYLATWTCLVAISGIIMMARYQYTQTLTLTIIGIGVAMATSAYGFYMLVSGYNLIKNDSRKRV